MGSRAKASTNLNMIHLPETMDPPEVINLQIPRFQQAQSFRAITQFNQDAMILQENFNDLMEANKIYQSQKKEIMGKT